MTWVIGACPALGSYAITVSDVQVTLPDGRTFDLVRKAYPLGLNIAGGFAGSVHIGFVLLQTAADMIRRRPGTKNAGLVPEDIAESWAPIAKRVFESAGKDEQELGAEFILVGPHPTEDIGIPGRARPYLCKFSAPDFSPQITRGGHRAISIGSGAHVPEYVQGIREIMDPTADQGGWLQQEMGNTGGWANGINIAISYMLEKHPITGISPYVHTHLASREGVKVMTHTVRFNIGTPEEKIVKMPKVVQSWPELLEMARTLGIDAASATA